MKNWKTLVYRIFETAILTGMALVAWFSVVRLFSLAETKISLSKDFWDALQSFGTLAAAIVALWIGISQGARAYATDRSKANVVAARIAPRLAACIDEVRLLWVRLHEYDSNVASGSQYVGIVSDHLDEAKWDLTPELLAALSPISHHGAQQLARGLALVELVRSRFQLAIARNPHVANAVPFSKQDALRWAQWIEEAQLLLTAASTDCQTAYRLPAR